MSEPAIVVVRDTELKNLLFRIEQARCFRLYKPDGTPLGYMKEETRVGSAMARLTSGKSRHFKINVYDLHGNNVLTFQRSHRWVTSNIRCLSGNQVLGRGDQEWHRLRCQYNLFAASKVDSGLMDHFGSIDTEFLGFDFALKDPDGNVMATITRNLTGISRELSTDTGIYVVHNTPDVIGEYKPSTRTLDSTERAVLLAAALAIDFDYYSQHSS